MNKYHAVQGDTWDMISYKVYGHEQGVGLLIKSNPKYIDTVIFKANVVINIPDFPLSMIQNLPPWKRWEDVND